MEFNFLGIAFIEDEIPKNKADKINEKMDEIIEKYKGLAQKEFDKFLENQKLESAMGVIIKKTS